MAGDLKTQLVVGADVEGATAGIANVRKSLDTLGPAASKAGKESSEGLKSTGDGAKVASDKIDAATRRIQLSIERQIAIMEAGTKSGADYYRVLANQRGANLDVLKPYLDQLDQVSQKQRAAGAALSAGAAQFNQYGVSAGQTAAALRQVPAQLTDIVTSLQGGQAPLTVLLQQGGQLRDSFGGVAPAARALGGAVLGLVNPFSVAAVAAGALGFAYFKGSQEADEFRKAIVLSGNVVGATTGLLADQARAVASVVGTQGEAAAAIAALAATGRVAFADLAAFGETSLRVFSATGQAVEETAKQYAALGRDPVEAMRKLNKESGLFNVTVLEQVKALIEQGRATEAATLAQRTYDAEISSRAKNITDNLGSIERGWKAITNASKEAIDAVLRIGRPTTVAQDLAEVQRQLRIGEQQAEAGGFFQGRRISSVDDPALQALRRREEDLLRTQADIRRGAAAQSELTRVQKAGFEAEERLSKIRLESADNTQKLAKALTEYRANLEAVRRANQNSPLLDPALIARDEAKIRAGFADKGARTPARRADPIPRAQLALDVENIRNAGAALVDTYTTSERILESVRAAGLLGDREYFEAKRAFIQLDAQAKEQAAQQEIDRLQREQLTGAAALENQKKIADAQAKITKARIDAAAQTEVLDNQEQGRIRRLALGYQQAQAAAEAFLQTLRNQNERSVEAVGMGDVRRDRNAGLNQIEDRYAQQRLQLESDRRSGAYREREADYERDLALINDYQAKATAAFEQGFDRRLAAQRDWAAGANRAIENYIDTTADAAKQTEQLFNRAFSSLEDALVTFTRTGKLNFKALADGIIADIIRIQIRAQISQAASSGTGWLGTLFSAIGLVSGGGAGTISGGSGLTIGPGRAFGGPVNAFGVNPVVERGEPEVLQTRRGTYLLNGSEPGMVKPLSMVPNQAGGGGAVNVTLINNGTPQRVVSQERISERELALITEDAAMKAEDRIVAAHADPNSRISRTLARTHQIQRRR